MYIFLQEDPTTAVGLIDWALSQVQDDNKALRTRIDELEELLAEARSSLQEKSKTGSTLTQGADDNHGPWMIKDPKRIGMILEQKYIRLYEIELTNFVVSEMNDLTTDALQNF